VEAVIDLQIDDEYLTQIDAESLAAIVGATLERHAAELGAIAQVTLVITGDEAVQALNRDFRGIDAPTDVLSFAAQ
jgi:probable rRNA maturation factor